MGLRPGRPSDSPSQGLIDEIWEQIEACWNHEPNARPTALRVLQTLLALSEARHVELVASVEDSDDVATIGEWEHVEDGTEDGPEESTSCVNCRDPPLDLDSTLLRIMVNPRL